MANRYFSNVMTLPVLKHRAYVKTTHATPDTAIALTVDAISAASLTHSLRVATFTAPEAHRLADGQMVTIAGADLSAYNGSFVITVTGATTFTYTMASTPSANASGTISATWTPIAQWAILFAAEDNADAISIGPDVNADFTTIGAANSYVLPLPTGARFSLEDWYVKSATASQVLHIMFV
jgi:hypothetical protein